MSEASQPLNALPQGYRLQKYELVRVLGFGGFGMTYLGFDHNLDKPVAIKEYLPSDIATRTVDRSVAAQASEFRGDFQWGLERFVDEARTLARFDHRHIIKVYRFFEAHGTAYIVMEYAEGETLSAHLERKGSLSEAELKAILYPLLDGLAVVHGADFLHRDIKPGNIVLRDVDGSPVLLDFGAARQAIGAKSRSVTSIVTPGYAPIEQYSTRGRQGPWTDIYALGGVCYRALTGDVPEDATDRVRDDPLVPVSQRCAGRASASFLSAVDWALSVDEGDRPQGVGAWRAAMEVGVRFPAIEVEAAEKAVDDATSERGVVQGVESLEQKNPSSNRFAVVLGVAALLVWGVLSLIESHRGLIDEQSRRLATKEVARDTVIVRDTVWVAAQPVVRRVVVRDTVVKRVVVRDTETVAAQPVVKRVVVRDTVEIVSEQLSSSAARAALDRRGLAYTADAFVEAAQYGNLAVVKLFVWAGMSLEATDVIGTTALYWAARYGHLEVVEFLVGAGADVHATGEYGRTALHWAARCSRSAAPSDATRARCADVVEYLDSLDEDG